MSKLSQAAGSGDQFQFLTALRTASALIEYGGTLVDGKVPELPSLIDVEKQFDTQLQEQSAAVLFSKEAIRGSLENLDALWKLRTNDLNEVDPKSGIFALVLAAINGHEKTVEWLIERDADIHQVWDDMGLNSLEICMGMFAEDDQTLEERHTRWRGIRALLKAGATLQDGSTPDLPDEPKD